MNILVVDDSVDFIDLMAEILTQEGHSVEKAYHGKQALELLTPDNGFDLLILDLIIPGYDGLDIINYISQEKIDIKVLAMSGGGSSLKANDILKAVKPKVDGILQKPFDLDELRLVVKNFAK